MSEQQNNQTAALGTAPVGPLLFRLALPTITAQVVNLLYSIVDRIYIGRIPLEGKLALTGMGITFPVITLISAFAALIGMGGAPRASIALGAKEHDRAERILGTCTAALWALALVLTALFLLFQAPLLKLFGASADTLPYAMQYLNIYVLGTVFVMTSLGLNGFITARKGGQLQITTADGKSSAVFVWMAGVDELHAELSEKRYRYNRPGIEEQPWGRVLSVTDPFGNRIHFCEPPQGEAAAS